MRTATEQLLISDAIDRAVQTIDFKPLTGQTVYLDDSKLEGIVDKNYLVSTMRQHLLASGCTLKDRREDAEFVVEARAGAVGTDRNDLLFGIPATTLPQITAGAPTAIPEVPLAKRLDQRGVAKISMFAYHRESGQPIWQSGLATRESSSNDVWLFGAGPFQYGTIQERQGSHVAHGHEGTDATDQGRRLQPGDKVGIGDHALFAVPEKIVKQFRRLPKTDELVATSSDSESTGEPAPAAQPAPAAAKIVTAPAAVLPSSSMPAGTPVAAANHADAQPAAVLPRLTGAISPAAVLRSELPKAGELASPAGANDSLALPQPRFDSR